MFANLHEDKLYITRYSIRRRYAIRRPSSFHKGLKSTVIQNLEGPFALSNPTDNLGSMFNVHCDEKVEYKKMYSKYLASLVVC